MNGQTVSGGLRFGFGFEARVGKDSAAVFLIEKFGGVQLSFAKPLYDIQKYVQVRCGLPAEKDRRLLQILGTEWGRDKDPDIWVKLLLQEARALPKETNIYVTDVRFPNEIAALAKNGFILVHIERPEHIRLNAFVSEAVGGSTKHASETALKDSAALWHVHILNDGTLEEFHTKLLALFPKRDFDFRLAQ